MLAPTAAAPRHPTASARGSGVRWPWWVRTSPRRVGDAVDHERRAGGHALAAPTVGQYSRRRRPGPHRGDRGQGWRHPMRPRDGGREPSRGNWEHGRGGGRGQQTWQAGRRWTATHAAGNGHPEHEKGSPSHSVLPWRSEAPSLSRACRCRERATGCYPWDCASVAPGRARRRAPAGGLGRYGGRGCRSAPAHITAPAGAAAGLLHPH
jgi:hypothetical protein